MTKQDVVCQAMLVAMALALQPNITFYISHEKQLEIIE